MDKAERETHDFMNVESFSQLPFIRPAPVKEKGIRLFGIEFGGDASAGEESELAETNEESVVPKDQNNNGDNSSRRFECHYCCRNFPTSQALGGHQNAHKRERQHAKRVHLQSAAAMVHHHHNSLSDSHIYGLMNYRLGSSAPTTTLPPVTYPSWNATTSTARFYGTHSSFSHQTPINGSPLGLWRIPSAAVQTNSTTFNRDRSSHPLPLFAGGDHDHHELKPSSQVGGSSSVQSHRYVYESKSSVQDQVSLDLHL